MAFTASSSFLLLLSPAPFFILFMEEEQLAKLIESRTKKPAKDYKLLEATLRPGKRKPKKRKIKRLKSWKRT